MISQLASTCLFMLAYQAAGHGFMSEPASRNWYAATAGQYSCSSNCDNIPKKEDTPQGLNRNDNFQCGKIDGGNNYAYPQNYLNQPLPWHTQTTYNPGQLIDVTVVLTAHHKGYFEFSACPLSSTNPPSSSSTNCFQQYPLEFDVDYLYGAKKDTNYPTRAYVAPINHYNVQSI